MLNDAGYVVVGDAVGLGIVWQLESRTLRPFGRISL
jgi:hypothetical protein